MRIYLVWLFVIVLGVYASKDWFKTVPVLIVMMAIYGHPDMPTGALGVQGLNPWNILLLFTIVAYVAQKKKEGSHWDLDRKTTNLLSLYVIVMLISGLRLLFDKDVLEYYGAMQTNGQIISEYLVNPLKFMAPAYFVYVGARTTERRKLVLWSIVGCHLLIALFVIKRVPVTYITDAERLTQVALKVLQQQFSWSRVNTATLLAGGAWATLFASGYLLNGRWKIVAMGTFGLMSLALALTGGRMGYVTWLVLGVIFSLTKWKKGILILPVVLAIVLAVLPAATDRMMQGVAQSDGDMQVEDMETVTSGRIIAWPIVIEYIKRAPFVGYGGEAMMRTGAMDEANELLGIPEGDRGFPHPHNAYLTLLFDTGILGALPVLWFWLIVFSRSIRLCGVKGSESDTIGMVTICLSLSLLIAGVGSQYFYPVHGSIAMWAAFAMTLRAFADRKKIVESTKSRRPVAIARGEHSVIHRR